MSFDSYTDDSLEELVEDLSDLRHDLGKYIGFETRFVGSDGPLEELREALRKDLLRTRDSRGSVESAWELWGRLRPVGLDAEPELAQIDESLVALRGVDLDGSREELLRAVRFAALVTSATRSLHRRAALLLHS